VLLRLLAVLAYQTLFQDLLFFMLVVVLEVMDTKEVRQLLLLAGMAAAVLAD
jgi:hypothetical protein